MGKKRRYATDAELAVLKQLWAKGPMTTRSITETLYPAENASDFATVQKLLQRLIDKRFVTRDRRAPAHVFRARITQEQFAGEQLEAMAEKLSDGSLAPFVMHLVKAQRLTKRERQEIRKLIQQ